MAALAVALSLTTLSATAEPVFTARHPQWGVRIGYGLDTGDELGGDVNPYELGFGLTAGYTFGMNLYLGASFEYYLGSFETILNGEASTRIWNAMFEPGYDIRLHKAVMIRPQVGLGLSSLRAETCQALPPPSGTGREECDEDTDNKFAVAPGAMVMFDDFGGLYGQLGVRYHHVFVEGGNASGLLFNVGVGAAF
jgi:hypothetical protein